jgi:hypothetical protein
MSLTVDLRLPGGGKSATITGVGQKLNLEIWATVKGANSVNDEALQMTAGSLLSSNINGGAANGTLSAVNIAPFTGPATSPGTKVDLDGDGDLDVGSNNFMVSGGHFVARAGSMQYGNSFKIGTATFTVTSLKSTTGQTNLVFRMQQSTQFHHIWREDNTPRSPAGGGTYLSGAPLVLKRSGGTTTTYSIAGNVWNDTDNDRVKDSTETNRASVRVFVDADRDGIFDSTERSAITNTSGNYTITGVAGGSVRVRVVPPSGYRVSTPTSGYHEFTLSANTSGRNFGVTNAPVTGTTYSVSGTVFTDNDGDGIKDIGEPGRASVRVFVDKDNDRVFDSGERSALTNTSGAYTITGVPTGTTRVRIVGISGYRMTTPSAGYHSFTLSGNTSGRNFGVTNKVLITGRAWVDSDKDNIKDSTEAVLSGWRVFIDKDKDGVFDSGEVSTLTDSAGNYKFTNLAAGSYRVRIVQASGYTRIAPTSGYYDKTLLSGQTTGSNNFRFTKP